jgi:acyl-CoA reductase-like NAD-dependent aldehyde dehydrogenase
MKTYGCSVGGSVVSEGERRAVLSPFDGRVVAEVVVGSAATLERAIALASDATAAMAALTRAERSRILDRCAELVGERKEALAQIIVGEMGKPVAYARTEVARAVDTLRASADAARHLAGDEIPLDAAGPGKGRLAFSRRFAVGPIASITPFNFPLNLVAHKVGPAIAAGCPNVLKPASATPLSALLLAEICAEAGLPAGGLSVVPCDRAVGERLVADERLKLLTFTGSAEVGWAMKARAGKKKVVLELGGNAAVLVMPDADLELAAQRTAIGAFYQAGQSCISVQRALVHRDAYARFRELLIEHTRRTPLGDPADPATVCGPLIDEANADRVERWIDEAVAAGARPLVRGARAGGVLAPSLVEHAPRSARLVAEEVFGPVVVLDEFDDLDDGLAMASDTRFGLQCGLFTRDLRAVMRAWDTLEVGALIHDDIPAFRVDLMPYGGVRDSGLGREGPRYAVEELTEPRLLVVRR